MIIAIRHFPDRKRPCIVLEEGNKAVAIGYLTNRTREKWLRKAYNLSDRATLAIAVDSLYTLEEILEEGEVKE